MAGHLNEGAEKFDDVLWADAELVSIKTDYDCIIVKILDSNGTIQKLRCNGYIGYESIGFWDEMIISTAKILKSHKLIDNCLNSIRERYENVPPASGNKYRNMNNWKVVQIIFIDNHEINIVAADISVSVKLR